MTPALTALVGFALWQLLLSLAIFLYRVRDVATGKARSDEFTGGVPHGGDRYWRLNRAQMNCAENLPVFGAIVLVDHVGWTGGEWIQVAAPIVLALRVCQTITHITSGSARAVNVRAAFYFPQCVLCAAMGLSIVL
jgi:uncharacterized MAPEG superfamily protein